MLIIDRIEGNTAVIEDGGKHFNVDISLFDGEFREGDVIIKADGRYRADKTETESRRAKLKALQDGLFGSE